jgi:hypothetical protein
MRNENVGRSRRIAMATAFLTAAWLCAQIPVGPAGAVDHSCGDVWCSGNDGTTRYNTQGNDPQIYIGEIGIYYVDFDPDHHTSPCSGVGGYCFNGPAANAALDKYQHGTGIGVHYYYILGGPASSLRPDGVTPYCWGWRQANQAFQNMSTSYGTWNAWALLIAADVEQETSLGWSLTSSSNNRAVVNGFKDHIQNATSDQPAGCSGTHTAYQPVVYSAPAMWSDFFSGNGSLPITPIWTYQKCCPGSWPADFHPSATRYADWFGNSDYNFAWQFDQNPDYDIAKEPLYMPALGFGLGS